MHHSMPYPSKQGLHRSPWNIPLCQGTVFRKNSTAWPNPMFRQLQENRRETGLCQLPHPGWGSGLLCDCLAGLKQNEATGGERQNHLRYNSIIFRSAENAFQLGEYYFRKTDYRNAILMYEKPYREFSGNREIADMKFHQGYGIFYLQQFDRQNRPWTPSGFYRMTPIFYPGTPIYYYGFIAFNWPEYNGCLDAFRKVRIILNMARLFHFISPVLYQQGGQRDEALQYAEAALKKSSSTYMIWNAPNDRPCYFEKKQYSKACHTLRHMLPRQTKISREDQYQLSFELWCQTVRKIHWRVQTAYVKARIR